MKKIRRRKLTKESALKVFELIEKQTRCEILSRHTNNQAMPDYGNFFQQKLDYEDKLRKFLFGTDDLVKLGLQWGILKPRKIKKKKGNRHTRELKEFFDGRNA